jgi:hypothetical protein
MVASTDENTIRKIAGRPRTGINAATSPNMLLDGIFAVATRGALVPTKLRSARGSNRGSSTRSTSLDLLTGSAVDTDDWPRLTGRASEGLATVPVGISEGWLAR